MSQRPLDSSPMSAAEFRPRGFWALVATQFQGAFNDNLYKYLIIFSLVTTYKGPSEKGVVDFSWAGLDITMEPYAYVTGFSTILFSLPFIIFPSLFGVIADKYGKGSTAIATKVMEVCIMALGGLAFYLGNSTLIWCILFLMTTQSALFGPVKYGIIPEIVPEQRLSWANGIIQMSTIVAVILGMELAGWIYGPFKDQLHFTALILMVFSGMGILSATWITRPPAANPHLAIPTNPFLPWKGLGTYFVIIWRDRVLFNVVIGYIYFWFAGALVQANIIAFTGDTLKWGEAYQSMLLGAVAIGIGIGALAAGFLSRNKIETGIIPIGALGMALFAALMAIPQAYYGLIISTGGTDANASGGAYAYILAVATFGLGFFAGAFDVPLAASIQHRAPRGTVGGIIATTNMLTFVGMAGSGVLIMVLSLIGFSTYQVFLLIAVMSLSVGIYIMVRLPHLLLRAVLWVLSNTILRIRVEGRPHFPDEGAALLVGNHISFIDCLAIFSGTDREISFVMGEGVMKRPLMGRLARILDVILVKENATEIDQERLVEAVREKLVMGNIVCINNEQQACPSGTPFPWCHDFQSITHGLDIPVVPFFLSRMWETLYVFRDGKLSWRFPKQIPHPIDLRFGVPTSTEVDLDQVQKQIRALGRLVHTERPLRVSLLHRGVVRMARRNLRKLAVADALTGEFSYFKVLTGSIVFARKLNARLDDQEKVGVILPPSVGGALTNLALLLMGRVPINLNYTASNDVIASCAHQCKVSQVVTSKKVVERLPIEIPGEAIFLEDLKASVSGIDRVIAMLLALACPVRLLEKLLGAGHRTPDDLATIVFSSGSEGEPKGVMLTHRNIITNIDATLEVFPNDRKSSIVGFLPFFHSFGFTATLWLPLIHGLAGIYHANPLEPKVIGKLTQKHRGTIMIGTSTFLQGFIRRCTPEQLESLEFVVCGAEKLAPRVRNAFNEKFGQEPLEGYGTTECAPVVSANITDCLSPGFYFPGTRHGTIGRPIPGVEVKIIDSETRADVSLGGTGLLLVKGPNIMQGYLDQPKKTAEVLQDGWYETGDIAQLDSDGFITITDRLARFSKIAGEMVPHTRVEETLHGLINLTEQRIAVAGVPDTQKGERLVVLHTLDEDELDALLIALKSSSMSNLWRPKANAFYQIDEIPVLGTGKMDIKAIKKMAQGFDLGG